MSLGGCGCCDVDIRGFLGEVVYQARCSQCPTQLGCCDVCYNTPRRLCARCRTETCGFCGDMRDGRGYPLDITTAPQRACERCGVVRLQCGDCRQLTDPLVCRGCTMAALGRPLWRK